MNSRKFHIVLFGLYCALMLWLLFDRPVFAQGIPYPEQLLSRLNLIPFRTLRLFGSLLDSGRPEYVRAAVINLGGNVLMFVPLGFLLPRVCEKVNTLARVLLTTAALITLVEIAQLLALVGSCDIDDLILNVAGAALGYGLHKHI